MNPLVRRMLKGCNITLLEVFTANGRLQRPLKSVTVTYEDGRYLVFLVYQEVSYMEKDLLVECRECKCIYSIAADVFERLK